MALSTRSCTFGKIVMAHHVCDISLNRIIISTCFPLNYAIMSINCHTMHSFCLYTGICIWKSQTGDLLQIHQSYCTFISPKFLIIYIHKLYMYKLSFSVSIHNLKIKCFCSGAWKGAMLLHILLNMKSTNIVLKMQTLFLFMLLIIVTFYFQVKSDLYTGSMESTWLPAWGSPSMGQAQKNSTIKFNVQIQCASWPNVFFLFF